MICKKCKTKNEVSAVFCKGCGERLDNEKESEDVNIIENEKEMVEDIKEKNEETSTFLKSFLSKNKLIILMSAISTVLVLIVIVGIFTIGSKVSKVNKGKYPIIYVKEDQFYIKENKDEKQKLSDTIVLKSNYINYEEYIGSSPSGKIIYFIEEYNEEKDIGELYIKEKGKEKQKIASDVNGDWVSISEDGSKILFLQDYNHEKYVGELYLYTKGKEKEKIASDVCANFCITPDGNKMTFIQNFSLDKFFGELYYKEIKKDKVKIDSEVNFLQYLSKDGNSIAYLKEYGEKYYSLANLYIKEKDKDPERIAYDVNIDSFITNNDGNQMAFIANYQEDKFCGDLYIKVLEEDLEKEKVDSDVTEIINNNYSIYNNLMDDLTVFYNKQYDTSETDLYVKKLGKEKEKLLNNSEDIFSFKHSNEGNAIAYIKDFDMDEMQGSLYIQKYEKGKWKDKEKISGEAHNFDMSDNGKRLLYLIDYIKNKGDLYLFEEEKEPIKISSDVNGVFRINETGNKVLFFTDYKNFKGNLWSFTVGQEKQKISSDIYTYETYDFDKVFYLKDYNEDKFVGDLYLKDGENQPERIDGDVTQIINLYE